MILFAVRSLLKILAIDKRVVRAWSLGVFLCLSLSSLGLGGCGIVADKINPPDAQIPLSLESYPGVTVFKPGAVPPVVMGALVYVPVYSEIYQRDQRRVSQMTVTLSLRNTNLKHPLIIDTVDYYDTAGKKIRSYLNQPIQLAPLASAAVVVEHADTMGGSGANFIVGWQAAQKISEPVIEAVMINTESQLGMSFISVGRVIERRGGS